MGNLFGIRRRAPPITAEDMAILKLKQTRDSITIYQKRIENDLEKNKELAFILLEKGAKDRALIVLRRKKFMQETLSRTQVQLEKLEDLVRDIEYSRIEVKVVEGLKVGTEALKQLNNLMDIGEIERMLEDNEEAAQKQEEISALLQGSSFDEEELLEELKKFQDNSVKIEDLPSVPKDPIKEEYIKEETIKEDSDGVEPVKESSPRRAVAIAE